MIDRVLYLLERIILLVCMGGSADDIHRRSVNHQRTVGVYGHHSDGVGEQDYAGLGAE